MSRGLCRLRRSRWHRTARRSVLSAPHTLLLALEGRPRQVVDAQRLAPSVAWSRISGVPGQLLKKRRPGSFSSSASAKTKKKRQAKAPQLMKL